MTTSHSRPRSTARPDRSSASWWRRLGTSEPAETVRALRRGSLVAVDVGVVDGKPFLNTASFGSYADFVDEREKIQDRIGKRGAALIAAAKVLRRAEPVDVKIDAALSVWQLEDNTWTSATPAPFPDRMEPGIGVVGSQLLVIGGQQGPNLERQQDARLLDLPPR